MTTDDPTFIEKHQFTICFLVALPISLTEFVEAWQATSGHLGSVIWLLAVFPIAATVWVCVLFLGLFGSALFEGVKNRNLLEIICSLWFLSGLFLWLLDRWGSV